MLKVLASQAVRREREEAAHAEFLRLTERVAVETERRYTQPVYGLKGLRGVYAAGQRVGPGEFRAYVASRDLPVEFPGIRSFGFIERLQRGEVERFTAAARLEGAPGFVVRTDGAASDLYVIKYIEPLASNGEAWGFDVGSDARCRAAIEQAISTGQPTLTAPVRLLKDLKLAPAHAFRLCGAFHKPVQPSQLQQALATAAKEPALPREPADAPAVHTFSAEEVAQAIVRGELVNHYQPKVDFAIGRWVGLETLVRWQNPQHGLVFPDRFIGVAEGNDLIDDLTAVVLFGLNGALSQARAMRDAGLTLQVSVNVSMDNLKDRNFPDTVAREAAAAGVEPNQLIIEVTESRMMQDPQAALDILTRLRLKRVGVSIDDFGTGHSSLTQLHNIPFDELKIDRSFVHGACRDAGLRAILLPSIDMARQLGIKTVAEGVEDAEDWHYLRLQGCTLAQGYFIAKPMAPQALAAGAAEWEGRSSRLCEASGQHRQQF